MRRAAAALALALLPALLLTGCERTARDGAALDADADARTRTAAKTLADLDAATKASASPLPRAAAAAMPPRPAPELADPAPDGNQGDPQAANAQY